MSQLSSTSLASSDVESAPPFNLNHLLFGLMAPIAITVLNMAMFSVALPVLRTEFAVEPDAAAWLVTSYTLPFVLFTPLYGSLGDSLGKRRMFVIGIILFGIGALLSLLASDQSWVMVGRVAQGMGMAGVNPMSIAIISEMVPPSQRGRVMGSWSSMGPGIAMFAPFLGGFLISHWGWRSNYLIMVVAAILALWMIWRYLPQAQLESNPANRSERRLLFYFDWIGFLLLGLAGTSLIFYLSSRPITGVEPLQDWRLLLISLLLFVGFYQWERRYHSPLVDFSLFRRKNFGRASLCALLRMVLMNSTDFLIPLYFTDVHHLSAFWLGTVLALFSSALLTTTRMAGQLSDRGKGRQMILLGFLTQGSMFAVFALLPATLPSVVAGVVLFILGMGAGLSLAVLSIIAMRDIPQAQSGVAAGLFSTIRFTGSIFGATFSGVLLRQALNTTATTISAYQLVFAGVSLVAFVAAILAWKLQTDKIEVGA